MYIIYTKGEDEMPPVIYCDDMVENGDWYDLYDNDPNTDEIVMTYKIREENIMYIEVMNKGEE